MSFAKVFAISLAGAILLAGGALYYFQSLISKVTDHPSAHIRAEPFVPRTMDTETREIDLGFSRFALPKAVPGTPVQIHGTLFVNFTSENSRPFLTVGPPVSDRDEAHRDLLAQFRALTGEASASWFETQKRTLEVQPFNVFGAIGKGLKASARDLTLLLMKGLCFGAARNTVRVFENKSTGAFIYHGETCAFIHVYDKARGVSQLFMADSEPGNLDHIASVIVHTYRARGESKTEAEFLEQLRATGIPNLPEPPPGAESTIESVERELKMIGEEVLQRRAKRSK